jgi:protein-serine/threonine kinase
MDWFRKKSLVNEMENENPAGTTAPQVVVTDPTSTTRAAVSIGGSAPPSAWSGQRVASATAIMQNQNGHGLLPPPGRDTRSASTREGSEARTPTTTSSGPPAGVMRVHEGAVDPGAVTSGAPPDQVYARVLEVLRGMGVDISTETLYKAQCVRPKQRKDGARQSGLAAFNITGLGGSNGVSRVEQYSRRFVFNCF